MNIFKKENSPDAEKKKAAPSRDLNFLAPRGPQMPERPKPIQLPSVALPVDETNSDNQAPHETNAGEQSLNANTAPAMPVNSDTAVSPQPEIPSNAAEPPQQVQVPVQAPAQAPVQPRQQSPVEKPVYKRPPLLTQPELTNPKVAEPEISRVNPPKKLVTLDDPNNPLGLVAAENRINETALLIDKKEYGTAKVMLIPLKQWLVEATEAHLSLYKSLTNISSARAQAELEKQLALSFAMLRDKSFFQMGKILMADNEYKKAVKELTEVIKSQPRSEIGVKAYELLQEIGFTQKLQLTE
ncbi:MAG: hypothetical protein K2X01_04620 [Cyanobacteria bacterium]|nr:hypothetical protein [Cyanobacteriota bacterium]